MSLKTRATNNRNAGIERITKIIGGKWKMVALAHLSDGPCRFNELRALMPNTTPRMLTMTLRDLERDGLITRTAYNEIPPRVEYALTAKGSDLNPALDALRQWSAVYLTDTPSEPSGPALAPGAKGSSQRSDQKTEPLNQPSDNQPPRPEATEAPTKPSPSLRPWGATAKAKIR